MQEILQHWTCKNVINEIVEFHYQLAKRYTSYNSWRMNVLQLRFQNANASEIVSFLSYKL